ncbi:hypothetical protein SPRG_00264 [Saprolegnia parasitica CBS 223.65]|uniref:TIR domain-containing protein n=1 Tax=Saprolegnia parasitica (strain CBS 223.65) TaxID=695850 RepID=A0A067D9T1_SAPPC|nr:hypothetical protein SPRG_00264 [Saprolegnia parasitica CBS 223.65]KDO35416.1 hypothetical protein SPRG_00264 [Saprolegnia parasitica CBS 223.65]|eukprot:XP_012193756.1 hypothetical protein SPRG_00264 [Saprolegnia parasitica CBS 223.65]
MGTASSRSALSAQDGPVQKLTCAELATFVKDLGPEFVPYSDMLLAQDIDSTRLMALSEADLMAACHVKDPSHVTTMLYHLKQLKAPAALTRSSSSRTLAKPKRRSVGRDDATTQAAEDARAAVQQMVLASIECAPLQRELSCETFVTPMEPHENNAPISPAKALPPLVHKPELPPKADENVIADTISSSLGGQPQAHTEPTQEATDAARASWSASSLPRTAETNTALNVASPPPTLPSRSSVPTSREADMSPMASTKFDIAHPSALDTTVRRSSSSRRHSLDLSHSAVAAQDGHPTAKPPDNDDGDEDDIVHPTMLAATAATRGLRPVMSIQSMVRDHFDDIVSVPSVAFDPNLDHYDAYFSYAVGKDSASRSVRERIARAHKLLTDNGIVVWYDAEKSATDNALIQQGLSHASVVVVFVTRHYMNLVNSDGQLESCQYEFSLALYTKTVERMIFIVLEDEMKRYDCLSGEFRIIIGDQECMDFTNDAYYDDACDELTEKIVELQRLPQKPVVDATSIETMAVSPLMTRLKQDQQPWDVSERVLKRPIGLAMASPVYADKMLAKGILPVMVHFVKLDQSDEEVPREAELAILLLKILARSSGVLRRKILLAIQDMSLLTSFTAYLTVGEGFTKEHMAGLIRNLFVVGGIKVFDKSDSFKQTIAALLKILGTGTMLQQYEAGAALCAISLNREYQPLLVEESAIPICMRKLTTSATHETVRDKAALVLRYLSGTEDNQREIGSEGGIVAFLNLLKSGTHSQRDTSAAALNWLMECAENRSRLVKENGIPTLLNYVVRGRKFVRQQTLSALSKLAPHAEYQIPLAKAGLLGPCVAILGVGNDSQKTAACIVLAALAATDLLVKMKDAIGPVVNLYCEGTVPQKKAAKIVLEKLSRHKPFKEQIVALVKEESLMLH